MEGRTMSKQSETETMTKQEIIRKAAEYLTKAADVLDRGEPVTDVLESVVPVGAYTADEMAQRLVSDAIHTLGTLDPRETAPDA